MSTQGDTLIVTDSQGTALAPAISWMDLRAEAEYHALLAATEQSFWYRENGKQLSTASSACALRWLAAWQPELWARVRRVAAVPDYLTARLCGQFVTDVPSASWSPCFNAHTRAWSHPVLALLGVSEAQLPRVLDSGTVIGTLSPDVAALLELTPDAVLVAGAFDQAAAALGAGASAGGRSILSCGTAWVLYTVTSPSRLMCRRCFRSVATRARQSGGIGFLYRGGGDDRCRRTFHIEAADAPGATVEPLFFLPYLYGAGAPDWQAKARGTLLGLTMAHSGADVERAVQCGIARETRLSVESSAAQCGPIHSLRMVGGASNSTVWPQNPRRPARSSHRSCGCSESAATGAPVLAAGAQHTAWPEITAEKVVLPDPQQVARMEDYYRRYQQYRSGCLNFTNRSGIRDS